MCVQPWMTADEIQEAAQSAIAANPTGPDGNPATVQTIYLRYIRDVSAFAVHSGSNIPAA